MSKIKLKDVTLVCVDDVDTNSAYQLLTHICQRITFGDVKLLSSNKTISNVTEIEPISSIADYDNFIFHNLKFYIKTEFAMIVQLDGFPMNYESWNNSFLKYDYIGAPWLVYNFPDDKMVGNSGFSIRSKKMMEELSKYDYNFSRDGAEDAYVCRKIDAELKSNGIKFASVGHARAFSVENMLYTGQFGFHGRGTLIMNKTQNSMPMPPWLDL